MKLFTSIRCLFLATMLMLSATSVFAQNVTVKGKVTDSRGEPVIGATVMLSGNQTVGALTDLDGNYSINVPSNSSLIFSCVGYATQTVAVDGRTSINIAFEEDTEFLDETVVIGYGTQRKRLLTGATINISGDDILKQSTTNALGAIYSSVPGVNIVQSSGGPGAGYNITVRGLGTTGSASPLVVIDGVASSMNSLNALNPADIESIDILKDAASAAIYGARAANGVVLVTTRQGKIGDKKATVTFDAYTGFQQPNTNGVHAVSATEYLDLIARAGLHEFDNIEQTMPVQMDWIRKGQWNGTDWFTESINKNAPTNNLALGVTGGGDAVRYSFSFSKSYQEGTLGAPKPTYYDRTTIRANTDFTVLKKDNRDVIKLGENVTFSITDSRDMGTTGRGSDVSNLLTKTPLLPAYDLDGSLYTYEKQVRDGWDARDNETNLLESQTLKESQGKSVRVQGNVYLEVNPFRELKLRTAFGFRANTSFSRSYTPEYQLTASDFKDYDSVSQSSSVSTNWTWELTANYKKTFFGDHTIEALAGTSIEATGWGMSVNGTRSSTKFGTWNSANLGSVEGALTSDEHASMGGGNTVPYNDLLSFFGRLNYSYKDKYLFTAIVRSDGSCNFAKGNRWGVFPSVSAGWVISEEPWMAGTKDWLNFFKIRGSWGQNGNCSISNFQYTGTISLSGQYDFSYDQTNPVTAAYPDKIPNSKLSWETSEQLDFGIDARLFSNRLTFTADYFNKQTKDLLFSVSIPSELGFSSVTTNGGNVLNSGWEFELGWKDHIGEVNYGISANFSTLHNEVLALAEGSTPSRRTDASSSNYQVETVFDVGYPIWYMNGYEFNGITSDGKAEFLDANGEPATVVTSADLKYLGQTTPKYTFGLNLNLDYKGFDFALYGSGVAGNVIMPIFHRTGFKNNMKYYLDAYESGKYPKPSETVGNYQFWSSSANVFKGNYFRIKQMQFGYTLPSRITKKASISNLRFYVSLDDYFTFTKYPGLDPETASMNNGSGAGLDFGSYPTMQKILLGVNITF